jgi:hypothetical protein
MSNLEFQPKAVLGLRNLGQLGAKIHQIFEIDHLHLLVKLEGRRRLMRHIDFALRVKLLR